MFLKSNHSLLRCFKLAVDVGDLHNAMAWTSSDGRVGQVVKHDFKRSRVYEFKEKDEKEHTYSDKLRMV